MSKTESKLQENEDNVSVKFGSKTARKFGMICAPMKGANFIWVGKSKKDWTP